MRRVVAVSVTGALLGCGHPSETVETPLIGNPPEPEVVISHNPPAFQLASAPVPAGFEMETWLNPEITGKGRVYVMAPGRCYLRTAIPDAPPGMYGSEDIACPEPMGKSPEVWAECANGDVWKGKDGSCECLWTGNPPPPPALMSKCPDT